MKFFKDTKKGIAEVFSGSADNENAYRLNGRVPLKRAMLIGVQHVLAMFVANVTPLLMLFTALSVTGTPLATEATIGALFIAGVSTFLQLLIGARLPIVMGSSFTFIGVLIAIGLSAGGGEEGYYTVLGAVLAGGVISSVFAVFIKYWGKLIKPIVPCVVVFALGLNLFKSGATQFLGGQAVLDGLTSGIGTSVLYYAYIVVAVITLLSCVLWQIFAKGTLKNLNIIVGLGVGYVICLFIPGMIDFSGVSVGKITDVISYPKVVDFSKLRFETVPILLTTLFFVVSMTEGIGNVSAVCSQTLCRAPTDREIGGILLTTCLTSSLSAVFGAFPLTSYSQNVGLVTKTKEVNRFGILIGAVILIILSCFPIVSSFLLTIPDCVIGGTMVILFGSIAVVGIQMCAGQGFSDKNILILSVSTCLGFGITLVSEFFTYLNACGLSYLANILSNNVLNMFVISFVLSRILPDSMDFGRKRKQKDL